MPASLAAGVVIRDALRLVAPVARGHDQRIADILEKQVMKRRVGQHEAERRLGGRDARRKLRAVLLLIQQNNRCRRLLKKSAFRVR